MRPGVGRQGFGVSVACRVLKVSRSGYCEWRDRPPSRRCLSYGELMVTIRRVHQQSRGAYGAPRRAARIDGQRRVQPGQRVLESLRSSMQRELLDRRSWTSKHVLASAMVEWIEGWDNPRRRHSEAGMLSPHEFETFHTAAAAAA